MNSIQKLHEELEKFEWFGRTSFKHMSKTEDLDQKSLWMNICYEVNKEILKKREILVDLQKIPVYI